METLQEARSRAFDDIERVLKLNAAGFVARVYDISTDDFAWAFGSIKMPQTPELEEAFKLCRGDDRIDWPQFRAWLVNLPQRQHQPPHWTRDQASGAARLVAA